MNKSGRKEINRHFDLEVYQKAFAAAMKIFELSKRFPAEEHYTLTDQIGRSSRSGCANHWISKLSDSDAKAAETQTWLQFATACGYLERAVSAELFKEYEAVIGMLVTMINHPEKWNPKPK